VTATTFAADAWILVELAAAALAAALVIGLPLGVCAAYLGPARGALLALAGVGRTLPSIAVLAFVLPFLGVGFAPAIVALMILAIPPIVINTDLGLRGVDPAALDAARGMGMTAGQRFFRVAWPLALPVVFTGVRTAAVEVIASATLATFIGAGGLGDEIVRGLQTADNTLLLAGAGGVAAIALTAELALSALGRRLAPAV
jgi:osmoprotectant transport system permease protein